MNLGSMLGWVMPLLKMTKFLFFFFKQRYFLRIFLLPRPGFQKRQQIAGCRKLQVICMPRLLDFLTETYFVCLAALAGAPKFTCLAARWSAMACDGRGVWRTQKARRSLADGSPVAWLLRPSGPLSSDCHSWGLRCTFWQQCHSSEPQPPTERRQAWAGLSWCHLSWQMERQRLETDRYLPPLICPAFVSLGSSIHHSEPPRSFTCRLFPRSAPFPAFPLHHIHISASRVQSALFMEENGVK